MFFLFICIYICHTVNLKKKERKKRTETKNVLVVHCPEKKPTWYVWPCPTCTRAGQPRQPKLICARNVNGIKMGNLWPQGRQGYEFFFRWTWIFPVSVPNTFGGLDNLLRQRHLSARGRQTPLRGSRGTVEGAVLSAPQPSSLNALALCFVCYCS